MPSPPSTRPSGSTGRRSSAFVREDLGRARGSALLVDHRCRFGSWRSSRPSFAYVIWLVSRVINVETKIAEELGAKLVEIANKRAPRPYRFLFLAPPAGRLGPLDHPIFTRWPAQYPDRLQG